MPIDPHGRLLPLPRGLPGALALLAVWGLAACAGGAEKGGGDASASSTGERLVARLAEWKVELSDSAIASGPVTLSVVNQGHLQHAVVVEGEGVQRISDHLAPGATTTLRLDLPPGRYAVYCPVKEGNDHDRLGMRTTLEVFPAPAQPKREDVGGEG